MTIAPEHPSPVHPGPGRVAPAADRLPRLLPDGAHVVDLRTHRARHGDLPAIDPAVLLDGLEAAGLTGRGGAGFPAARKWRAVASRPGPAVVVANGAEGEPASSKDHVLLVTNPHLVIDGLVAAARTVDATRAILYVEPSPEVLSAVNRALAERGESSIEVVPARPRFVAGQESAVVDAIGGGLGLPRATPPRVYERGVDRLPTLVQNVETLAHAALVARYGPGWYRAVGTAAEPGSMLTTVHGTGADGRGRAVVEAAIGTPLDQLVDLDHARAVLVGGYHGTWIGVDAARSAALSRASLGGVGGALGAGVVAPLPGWACGLVETARVMAYLASESAGQCGPCLNGLPRMAVVVEALAEGRATPADLADLQRWAGLVRGRGACAHPDGTARFLASAMTVFDDEVHLHLAGRCSSTDRRPVLDVRRRS